MGARKYKSDETLQFLNDSGDMIKGATLYLHATGKVGVVINDVPDGEFGAVDVACQAMVSNGGGFAGLAGDTVSVSAGGDLAGAGAGVYDIGKLVYDVAATDAEALVLLNA